MMNENFDSQGYNSSELSDMDIVCKFEQRIDVRSLSSEQIAVKMHSVLQDMISEQLITWQRARRFIARNPSYDYD